MAYKGTTATHGRGRGLVVATGMATELGKVAGLLDRDTDRSTPLQLRLAAFGKRLALAVLAICVVIFLVGVMRGEAPVLMILTAVSLAVAAIPEALPAVVTILLALGARRMVRQRADPPPAGGRNAGLGHLHLLRQDRHPDAEPHAGRGRFFDGEACRMEPGRPRAASSGTVARGSLVQ